MLTGEGDGRKRSAVSMNKEKPHCAFESYLGDETNEGCSRAERWATHLI